MAKLFCKVGEMRDSGEPLLVIKAEGAGGAASAVEDSNSKPVGAAAAISGTTSYLSLDVPALLQAYAAGATTVWGVLGLEHGGARYIGRRAFS